MISGASEPAQPTRTVGDTQGHFSSNHCYWALGSEVLSLKSLPICIHLDTAPRSIRIGRHYLITCFLLHAKMHSSRYDKPFEEQRMGILI